MSNVCAVGVSYYELTNHTSGWTYITFILKQVNSLSKVTISMYVWTMSYIRQDAHIDDILSHFCMILLSLLVFVNSCS